ncbi:hypothetical protein ZWY2020_023600 [Hordeum vulgare]|nr:hypothetical protein ZWY2020_023600 [Hordeum vulgare]
MSRLGHHMPKATKERDTGRERGLQQVSLEVESFEDIGFVEDVLVAMREVVITNPTENQCVDRFDELVLEEEVLARMREASITKPPRSSASAAEVSRDGDRIDVGKSMRSVSGGDMEEEEEEENGKNDEEGNEKDTEGEKEEEEADDEENDKNEEHEKEEEKKQ